MQGGGRFSWFTLFHDVKGRREMAQQAVSGERAQPVCRVSVEPGARCRGGGSRLEEGPLPEAA